MAFTTFNPSDKNAAIVLSGGNLTVSNVSSGSNFEGVRCVDFLTAGKYYVEFTIILISGAFSSNGSFALGIADSAQTIANAVLGATAHGYGWYPWSGLSFVNGAAGTIQVDQTVGHVLSAAYDLDNNKIWTRANGGNWNNAAIGSQDPANNIGGVSLSPLNASKTIAGFCLQGGSFSLNAGATAFSFTPPVGFTAGWPAPAGATALSGGFFGA